MEARSRPVRRQLRGVDRPLGRPVFPWLPPPLDLGMKTVSDSQTLRGSRETATIPTGPPPTGRQYSRPEPRPDGSGATTATPKGGSRRSAPSWPRFRNFMPRAWQTPLSVHLGDAAVAVVAALVALWVWSRIDGNPFTVAFVRGHALWFLLAPAWVAVLGPMHRSPAALSTSQTVTLVAQGAATVAGFYVAAYFVAPRDLLPRLVVLNFLAVVSAMTLAWRMTYGRLSTTEAHRIPVAVVGTGSKARALAHLLQEAAPDKKLVAFVYADSPAAPVPPLPAPLIAAGDLPQLAADRRVSEVFLAPDRRIAPELLRILVDAQERRVDVVPLETAYERLLERLPIQHLEGSSVLASVAHAKRATPVSELVHRLVDLIAGCLGSAVLLPAPACHRFRRLAGHRETGLLCSGACRSCRPFFSLAEVPHDATRCGARRPALGQCRRLPRELVRPAPQAVTPGRAPAALECPPRGDESRRTSTGTT